MQSGRESLLNKTCNLICRKDFDIEFWIGCGNKGTKVEFGWFIESEGLLVKTWKK